MTREVWVLEDKRGNPREISMLKRRVQPTIADTVNGFALTRYIPEQSALSSAQGEGRASWAVAVLDATWAANPPVPGSVFDEWKRRRDHEWPRIDLDDLRSDAKAEVASE
jgi:hypothetical protein